MATATIDLNLKEVKTRTRKGQPIRQELTGKLLELAEGAKANKAKLAEAKKVDETFKETFKKLHQLTGQREFHGPNGLLVLIVPGGRSGIDDNAVRRDHGDAYDVTYTWETPKPV